MKPSKEFLLQKRNFWAYVKLVSEELGYSSRKDKQLRRYSVDEVAGCLKYRDLATEPVVHTSGKPTQFGKRLVGYLNSRAGLLESQVRPNLMNREQARKEFERLRRRLKPSCALPLNKQKGEKRHHAYLMGMVNMLTEEALGGVAFDDNPRGLTVITSAGKPLRTLSRWMDGAYPSINNPKAIWEVKEYYGTTTFGSRVADGVYETMLDGEELGELRVSERIHVLHYLVIDDYFTWWDCGRSYLCRIVDMLHMGLVDEVLVGREVLTRWPVIVAGWK